MPALLLTGACDLQQNTPVIPSANSSPGSPDTSPHEHDAVQVCCNALYVSSHQATPCPEGHRQDSVASVTSVSQQHLDDTKENLAPWVDAPAAACPWSQCVQEAHGFATATCCSPRRVHEHAAQQASSIYHARTACTCVNPLQPLPVGDVWPSTLLPVPSSSAMTPALIHPLTQQPSHVVSQTASESGNQPAADVCLFGSPPRDSIDMQRSVWSMACASMEQQEDNLIGGSRLMGSRQTMLVPQGGHLCGAPPQGEEAVGGSGSQDVSAEKAFRQLLESAQRQRVSHALAIPCGVCENS